MERLNGKKTYLLALAWICFALFGYSAGVFTLEQAVQYILYGLSFAGLRHGVDKITKKFTLFPENSNNPEK